MFVTLLISVLIVFIITFYQNNSPEYELDKFSYKKYLYELGFSKTENPTSEEIKNYDNYIHLYSQAANIEDENRDDRAEQLYLESTKYSIKGYRDLGDFYLNNNKNYNKAIEYYKLAYDKGDVVSASKLGQIYGELKDVGKSEYWYKKGIELGDINSEIYMGKKLYLDNKKEKSEILFRKAMKSSKNAIPIYYLMILNFEKNNINEVKKLNKKLKEKSIENLNDDILVSTKYMLGNKKEQNIFKLLKNANNFIEKEHYKEAEKEYEKVIKYDDKLKYYLGILYEKYMGNDFDKIIKLYKEAAQKGEKRAFHRLGNIYFQKNKIEESYEQYKNGAEKGDSISQYNFAEILYAQGKKTEAIKYYKKSIKQKNIFSILVMLDYYNDEKNYKEMKRLIYKVFNEQEILYLNEEIKLGLLNTLRKIEIEEK